MLCNTLSLPRLRSFRNPLLSARPFALLAALAVTALTIPAFARELKPLRDAGALPKGLKIADWKQIRAEYEKHRHGAFPSAGGGLEARSFEQQWLSKFDRRGFTVIPDEGKWSWGLELAGVEGKATVTKDVNRITYRWSKDLDEWYLNDTRGLEHGFTLRAPRPEIRLAVRGGLAPRLAGSDVEFVDAKGTPRMKYFGLTARDADGRLLKSVMNVERGQVILSVDDRGARYPISIDPTVQQAYLKASNTGAGDLFGYSVAISGDTVAVGASQESSNATGVGGNQADDSAANSGAVYIFVRNSGTWSQQAYLKASNTDAGDHFGASAAISGNTLAVGAPNEASNATGVGGNQVDNSAANSGAVYIFVRNSGAWSQQAYLKASNTGASDQFGTSVSVSGDTVAVGAHYEDSNATGVGGNQANNTGFDSGAAYIFVRNSGTWSQQAYLKASNTGAGDAFGYSVSVSGDTVAVGAFLEDSNATGVGGNQANNTATNSGAAYIFIRNSSTWSQQAYLKASNTGAYDLFGYSVSISGDTIAVGALSEASNATGVGGNQADDSAYGSGAVYVFARSGSTWSQQAYLKASNTGASDQFGYQVSISGDTVVVGANQEDSNATGVGGNQADNSAANSGAVYLFVRNSGVWTQQAYLKASNTDAADQFGNSVAISGDTIAVGAYVEASSATGVGGNQADNSGASGAAYVFVVQSTVSVALATSPAGLSFTTSGTGCAPGTYTAPQTLEWTPGSSCSVSVTTPQTATGLEYRFSQWEDSSTFSTRTITAPAAPATYTATFDTYYQLTTSAGTGGNVSAGGFILSGTNTSVTATPSFGFAFTNFTGAVTSTSNPLSLLMNGAKSITANFTPALVGVTVTGSPSGLSFSTSGTGCAPGNYTSPQTLQWTIGSSCSVTFATPQSGGAGVEYRFNHWEDSSTSAARSITAPSSATTFTATFDTYYQLTTAAGLGGSVSAGGFMLAGTNANITATPSGGFTFTNLTGTVTSTSNPLSLLMDAPKSATANFVSSGAPLLTASISAKANGALPNERLWTILVTNTGAGAITNARVAGVEVLAANPVGNLGLISLGTTVYPAAVANPALSPGQSSTVPVSIIFPATSPVTRIQFRINLAGDNGYTNSVTLSNVVR